MNNPKFLLAGAAVGAYTQDPTEHPLAGLTGAAIGAYVGNNIKLEVVGKSREAMTSAEAIRIDPTKLTDEYDFSESVYRTLQKRYKHINKLQDRLNLRMDYINQISEAYRTLGGTADVGLESNNFKKLILTSTLTAPVAHARFKSELMDVFGSQEELRRFNMASKLVTVVEDRNVRDGKRYGHIESNFAKLNEELLNPQAPSFNNGPVVNISRSASQQDKLDTIQKHLVENLNYPQDVAERVARNIEANTNGAALDLQSNKLTVTANSESSILELEQYGGFSDGTGESRRPYLISDSGNLYSTPGHNPMFSMRPNASLGAQVSYIDADGKIVSTASMNDGVLNTRFTSAEAALFEWNMGGRASSLDSIKAEYQKNKILLGRYNTIKANEDISPNSVHMALERSELTDISRQAHIRQDGTFSFRQMDPDRLKEVTATMDKFNSGQYKYTFEGVGINATSHVNIGNKADPNKIVSYAANHPERALDSRLNRRIPVADSDNVLNDALRILNSQGMDTSSFGIGNVLNPMGVSNSTHSITNFIGSGKAAADGQMIISKEAVAGSEVRKSFSLFVGKEDAGYSPMDLTGGRMYEDARAIASGEAVPNVYKSGEGIGVSSDGKRLKIPEYFTEAVFSGSRKDSSGNVFLDFEGAYLPEEHGSTVKIYGDTKATAIKVSSEEFARHRLGVALENRGFLDSITGYAKPETINMFKGFGIDIGTGSYKEVGEVISQLDMDTIRALSSIPGVDESVNAIVRSDDLKLYKFSSGDITPQEAATRARELLAKLPEESPIRQAYTSKLDSLAGDAEALRKEAKGISFAITALTDSKSSQTGFLTAAAYGVTDTQEFAESIKNLSGLVIASEAGSEEAGQELFEALHKAGSNSAGLMVPFSIDTPIPNTAIHGMSWMQAREMIAQGYTKEMLDKVSSLDESARYEAKALLSATEEATTSVTDVFGQDFKEAKKNLSALYSTDTTNRAEIIQGLTGKTPEDGILNIALSRRGKEISSIPIQTVNTNRSGVFTQNGENLIPQKDRAIRQALEQELLYREAVASGNEILIKQREQMLDDAVSNLEGVYRQMDKNLSKAVAGRLSHNGDDLKMLATGGTNYQLWDEFAEKGINVAFVNRQAVEALGYNLDKEVDGLKAAHGSSYYAGVALPDGRRFLTSDVDGEVPIMLNVAREPVVGPNSNVATFAVYDPKLDEINEKAMFFTENASGLDKSGPSRMVFQNADFDGDMARVIDMTRISNTRSGEEIFKYNMQDYIWSVKEQGKYSASLVVKGGGASQVSLPWEQDNRAANLVESRFKGQERKFNAHKVTELALTMAESAQRAMDVQYSDLNKSFGVSGLSEAMQLEPERFQEYQTQYRALRKARYNSGSLGQFYVESTLKAVHAKNGSKSSSLDHIFDVLDQARQFNTKSDEAGEFIQKAVLQEFGENAQKIDDNAYKVLQDTAGFVKESISKYGRQVHSNPNRMVGGSGYGKNVRAAMNEESVVRAKEVLSNVGNSGTITGAKDVQSSLISTIKTNRNLIFGGAAALGATAFVMGSETPDMSSPMNNAPVSRSGNVLPPLKQDNAYITSSINRKSSPQGSVTINGESLSSYSDDGLKRRMSNMFQGDTAGRTTIRYQSNGNY